MSSDAQHAMCMGVWSRNLRAKTMRYRSNQPLPPQNIFASLRGCSVQYAAAPTHAQITQPFLHIAQNVLYLQTNYEFQC